MPATLDVLAKRIPIVARDFAELALEIQFGFLLQTPILADLLEFQRDSLFVSDSQRRPWMPGDPLGWIRHR